MGKCATDQDIKFVEERAQFSNKDYLCVKDTHHSISPMGNINSNSAVSECCVCMWRA